MSVLAVAWVVVGVCWVTVTAGWIWLWREKAAVDLAARAHHDRIMGHDLPLEERRARLQQLRARRAETYRGHL